MEKPQPLQRSYFAMQFVNLKMQQTRRFLQQSKDMRSQLVILIFGSLLAIAATTPLPDRMSTSKSHFALAADAPRHTKVLSQAMLAAGP